MMRMLSGFDARLPDVRSSPNAMRGRTPSPRAPAAVADRMRKSRLVVDMKRGIEGRKNVMDEGLEHEERHWSGTAGPVPPRCTDSVCPSRPAPRAVPDESA